VKNGYVFEVQFTEKYNYGGSSPRITEYTQIFITDTKNLEEIENKESYHCRTITINTAKYLGECKILCSNG
jgi:hypothetical protein